MRVLTPMVLFSCAAFAQSFDVASVKPSAVTAGKDYYNQIAITATGFSGRNVTLKRLIEEAYSLQPHQVFGGPKWLDDSEYDIEAKAGPPATQEQVRLMLRTLLSDRFHLAVHHETRELRVYDLVIDKGGPKIQPAKDSETGAGKPGFQHFRGEMRQLANLISVQLAIVLVDDPTRPGVASGPPVPVIEKSGLAGTYDFDFVMKPEAGADMFTLWQRILQEQLGLKMESTKPHVEGLVVDRVERAPTAN